MCGILFGINCYGDISNISNIVKNASAINNRGPDKTAIGFDNKAMWMFHRLAIRSSNFTNSSRSDFIENDRYLLLCNGEVYVPEGYNYTLNDPLKNYQSDCDFILEEFMVNGIEGVKNLLRYSEYALVIYDKILKNIVLVLRDRFGIRPLFRIEDPNNGDVIFTSEIKYVIDESLDKKFESIRVNDNVINRIVSNNNNYIITQVPGYYEKPYQSIKQSSNTRQYLSLEQKTGLLHNTLNASIYDRISTSDTPVGYLLSGGMDSSIICAMAARLVQPKKIRTFAIGLDPNATDVIAAKVVADFIGSDHTTIILKPQDFLSHVRETIYFEETYDITTIRA